MAKRHADVAQRRGRAYLLERLPALSKLLHDAYRYFADASDEKQILSFAAEWLLDNYYLVQQALAEVKHDLPRSYYNQLLKLVSDDAPNDTPRIFWVAVELLQFESCHLDSAHLRQYIVAYQEETSLTMGELWALPIMLRLVLLESLAQVVGRITGLLCTESVPAVLRLEHTLGDEDVVANAITGLRTVNEQDWDAFFEDVSRVEHVLAHDPAGTYSLMDFSTRNRYRNAIEQLARGSIREEEIAQAAVDLAQTTHATLSASGDVVTPSNDGAGNPARETDRDVRASHVGYYLVDDGRQQLDEKIGYRLPLRERVMRWLYRHATGVYLGSNSFLTLLLLLCVVWVGMAAHGNVWQVVVALFLFSVPAVSVSVSLVNWLLTLILPPRVLPKLNFEDGVPASCRTMVVVPALLSGSESLEALFSQLELHYLRNVEPNNQVTFALLTDFSDASSEVTDQDQTLLDQAVAIVNGLNEKYPGHPFYLFHRRRLWNPAEGVWMGWERKRGKLEEFNRLLRSPFDAEKQTIDPNPTSYNMTVGDLSVLSQVRYVITLDADTVLPRDGAYRLAGTLAHPLNRALFDPDSGRVTAGYTLLQPRAEVNSTSANRSLFTQVFAGDAGVDLYTLAVSDVYQDLFGEGSYVGKGIYDVDAFARSLKGRVPENALLSHDLFEGVQGRAGLVTDIVLYEDYPPHYLINVRRSHRWVRGDWQLLPWLFSRVPAGTGPMPNSLPLIARWKIADNLRRSLVSPLLLLFFVAAWTILPGSPLVWTLFGIVTSAVSLLSSSTAALVRLTQGDRASAVTRRLWYSVIRWALQLAFLPYEALLATHAITITLWRVYVSRKHLLEWVTSARTTRLAGENISAGTTIRQMVPSLLIVIPIILVVALTRPAAILAAAPLCVLWLLAAQIAHYISQPDEQMDYVPTVEEYRSLRSLTRRTWLFYEQFVGPDDNWLPPDHFQEAPRGVVAHRTSPTNVGLYLLSTVVAHDLGYVSAINMTLRLRMAFDAFERLERYRGHFINWFNTNDLTTLLPGYVSTVDSGNLAACLLALKQACLTMRHELVWDWMAWQGLLDTVALLAEVLANASGEIEAADSAATLHNQLEVIREQVVAVRDQPEQWIDLLERLLRQEAPALNQKLVEFVTDQASAMSADTVRTVRLYARLIHSHLANMHYEMNGLLPWLAALNQTPEYFTRPDVPADILGAWRQLLEALPADVKLTNLTEIHVAAHLRLADVRVLLSQELAKRTRSGEAGPTTDAHAAVDHALEWCRNLTESLRSGQDMAAGLLLDLEEIAGKAQRYVDEMDFGFLFDEQRQIFHIGYNLNTRKLDNNYYDLLASEARIASLLAIAKYEVPQSHWLHLARPFTHVDGSNALLSWSGTMFEYLMPTLLAPSLPGHITCAELRSGSPPPNCLWAAAPSSVGNFGIGLLSV